MLDKLEGDNSFLVSFAKLPDLIFCASKGSSSLLVTDNGYVSSDSYAIAGKAKEAKRIKNSVVCLSSEGIVHSVKLSNNSIVTESVPQDTINSEPLGQHHMLNEIKEQYSLIEDMGNYPMYHPPFRPESLHLIGCGSSYYAAMWAKVWFEELAKIPTKVTYGSEAINVTLKDPKETKIYITQSGETK